VRERAYQGGRAIVARYAAQGAISLVGSVVLIRALGTDAWATYSVAYFLVVYLEQTFSFRLLGRLIHLERKPGRAAVQASAALMHAVGLVTFMLFAVAGQLLGDATALPELQTALLAVGISSYVYALRGPSVALLERELRYRSIALGDAADHLGFYILAVTLVSLDVGLTGVLLALTVRGFPSLLVARWRAPAPFFGRWAPKEIVKLLSFAVPGFGSGLVALLEGLVPVVLLAEQYPEELAFTMTAATVVGYAAVAQFVTQRLGFSGLARLRTNPSEFRRGVQAAYDASTFTLITTVVPVSALAPLWLPFLFGDAWERAAPVLIAMGAAFLFNGPLYVLTGALLALGRPKATMYLNYGLLAGFVATALAAVGLSPLIGVAVSYAASRAAGIGLAWILLARDHAAPRAIRSAVAATAGILAACGIAALLAAGQWGLAAGLGLLVSGAWVFLFRRNRGWMRAALPSLPFARSRPARVASAHDRPDR
jgi:O-antigen/teichoic acid export membrane protein